MAKWNSGGRARRAATFGQVSRSVQKSAGSGRGTARAPSVEADDTLEVLPEYTRVKDLLDSGSRMILVSGGAGTGKSTFIRWMRSVFDGSAIVAAPTGIAAITVGGQTIHSLCSFPPTWILDSDVKRKEKTPTIKADVLIIDEVSMVNANVLDKVDAFLRLNRNSSHPFGGIAVVLVGDLFQLPPIVNRETQHLFAAEYHSPRFFAARSLAQVRFHDVELTRTFRQSDAAFVDILARIREGVDLPEAIRDLNRGASILPSGREEAVWLCPRNADVDRINQDRLERLSGRTQTYSAEKEGDYRASPLPVPGNLTLKVGAQVVMANNTSEWVNGSIATVTELLPQRIRIRLIGSTKIHEVARHKWEQYEYVLNEESGAIERIIIGTYSQIPANLAWAMTIHKSQGLTLDQVHLDLGAGAFASGQTYVALSRCTQLSNLSMRRPLEERDVLVDPEATAFYRAIRE
ncbi:DEAD/DEAH box helicase [Actinomycetota bacterium]|nr:DEAD/DEAH box helicase [Actinomycetota bacterium]